MKALGNVLGPRDSWSTAALRALWEPLKDLRGGRGKSPQHEARWLNLVGYTLRPGVGYPLDDWRVKETGACSMAGVVHEKDDPSGSSGDLVAPRLGRPHQNPAGRDL